MDDLATLVIDIRSDVDDLSDSYDINELSDEEELSNYQAKLETVKRNFRRIHAQIKSNEGEEAFQKKYPYYDEDLASLTEKFKSATKKLSEVRKRNKEDVNNLEAQIAQAQVEREKSKCIAVQKCL